MINTHLDEIDNCRRVSVCKGRCDISLLDHKKWFSICNNCGCYDRFKFDWGTAKINLNLFCYCDTFNFKNNWKSVDFIEPFILDNRYKTSLYHNWESDNIKTSNDLVPSD